MVRCAHICISLQYHASAEAQAHIFTSIIQSVSVLLSEVQADACKYTANTVEGTTVMSSLTRDRLGQWASGDNVCPLRTSGLDRLRDPGLNKVKFMIELIFFIVFNY